MGLRVYLTMEPLEMSEPVCPDCGNTGIGLLGIHEWIEWREHPDTPEQPCPVHHEQEEYGTPCPTCGRVADAGLDRA